MLTVVCVIDITLSCETSIDQHKSDSNALIKEVFNVINDPKICDVVDNVC